MRIHHLNCISSCPLGGYYMDGLTKGSLRGRLACHCLLLEGRSSLILVDTGFGLGDVRAPRTRLSRAFYELMRPELREEMTAIRQIASLGFNPRDVRHIVLTHLDFDHAGGLDDFPQATVHLLMEEQRAALAQKTLLDRMRYRPAQWSPTLSQWRGYPMARGEPWYGFDCVRELHGVLDDVLLVPLVGHTLGHAGVAVRRAASDSWLLLAGDAYFHRDELDPQHPYCTPGLRLYQTLMEKDRARRLENQARLRELKSQHGTNVTLLCSHDPIEFEREAGRGLGAPAIAAADRTEPAGAPVLPKTPSVLA